MVISREWIDPFEMRSSLKKFYSDIQLLSDDSFTRPWFLTFVTDTITRLNEESKGGVYERLDMAGNARRMNCGVIDL